MTVSLTHILVLVALFLSLASRTSAVATLPIEGELDIPNGDSATNILITLNGGEHSALSNIDGRFEFHDVPTGIYLLDVLSIHQVSTLMSGNMAQVFSILE